MIFSQIVITNTDFYLIFWTNREDLRLTGELEIKTRFTDLGIFGGLLLFVILVRLFQRLLKYFLQGILYIDCVHSRSCFF